MRGIVQWRPYIQSLRWLGSVSLSCKLLSNDGTVRFQRPDVCIFYSARPRRFSFSLTEPAGHLCLSPRLTARHLALALF